MPLRFAMVGSIASPIAGAAERPTSNALIRRTMETENTISTMPVHTKPSAPENGLSLPSHRGNPKPFSLKIEVNVCATGALSLKGCLTAWRM